MVFALLSSSPTEDKFIFAPYEAPFEHYFMRDHICAVIERYGAYTDLAHSTECQAPNLVVVGSSPTAGVLPFCAGVREFITTVCET
jgi:hypothetical protein